MDNSFVDSMKSFMQSELRRIELDGFPPFWVGPLTIKQAQDIEAETDKMLQLARHFQVRAKDENGKLLIKAGLAFDNFVREADLDLVSKAVIAMNEGDTSIEDAEKN